MLKLLDIVCCIQIVKENYYQKMILMCKNPLNFEYLILDQLFVFFFMFSFNIFILKLSYFLQLMNFRGCEIQCQTGCISGTEFCFGQKIDEASSYIKRDPTDKRQYIFCKCHQLCKDLECS